jgi:hypothetical protein
MESPLSLPHSNCKKNGKSPLSTTFKLQKKNGNLPLYQIEVGLTKTKHTGFKALQRE